MSFNSVNNFRTFLVLLAYINTNLNMWTFNLRSKSLTDIMEKTCTSCDICVNTKLGSKDACKLCNFDRVVQYILAVARTEFKTSDKLYKFVVDVVNVCLKYSTFTLLLNLVFNLTSCLVNHFLNPCRMNTTVRYEFFKCNSCNLASYLVKAWKCDCLRSVVNYEVNTCKCFKCTDITSFTSDYTTLHLVVRKCYNWNWWFGNLVCRTFCDCKRDIVSCFFFTGILYLLFVSSDFKCLFVDKFSFKLRDDVLFGLFSCKFRNLFKDVHLAFFDWFRFRELFVSWFYLVLKNLFLLLKVVILLVKIFLFLLNSSFLSWNLTSSVFYFLVSFRLDFIDFIFCFNKCCFLTVFAFNLSTFN